MKTNEIYNLDNYTYCEWDAGNNAYYLTFSYQGKDYTVVVYDRDLPDDFAEKLKTVDGYDEENLAEFISYGEHD